VNKFKYKSCFFAKFDLFIFMVAKYFLVTKRNFLGEYDLVLNIY